MAEAIVRNYSELYNFDYVIIRPCWFYGPNQPERQTKLFRMIKKGKPLIIGDGRNIRSMSYIDNTVQALLLAKKYNKPRGTFWIADKRPYTMNEIYETIANLLDVKNYKPRYLPSFISSVGEKLDGFLQSMGLYNQYIHVAGESTSNIACSIVKAEKELNYKPEIELEEGMRRSIEWCRKNQLL